MHTAACHRSWAMTTIQKKLGRAVRRLRLQADYSQESFAAAAGIHRTYMGLVERGHVAATITTIQKISNALGITMSALLEEAENER
jgi:transcriptional regulator with XRE-family HTH domain